MSQRWDGSSARAGRVPRTPRVGEGKRRSASRQQPGVTLDRSEDGRAVPKGVGEEEEEEEEEEEPSPIMINVMVAALAVLTNALGEELFIHTNYTTLSLCALAVKRDGC